MDPDDCFALLDFPRSAHLDDADLRERYHALVRERIDAATGGGDAGQVLHRAYEILADPVLRLRHLLRLVAPDRKGGGAALSADLMGLFSEVGAMLHRADQLLGKLGQTTSALGRALLAADEAEVQLELQVILGQLTEAWDAEIEGLPHLGVEDPSAIEAALGRLRVVQKWKSELQARLLKFLTG
jgi:hypothetical protein